MIATAKHASVAASGTAIAATTPLFIVTLVGLTKRPPRVTAAALAAFLARFWLAECFFSSCDSCLRRVTHTWIGTRR
eukprot:3749130-Prymnesium_polylepis.1